jgi:hypothetical protein
MHLDNLGKETVMPTKPAETTASKPQSQVKSTSEKPQFPANIVFRNDQRIEKISKK